MANKLLYLFDQETGRNYPLKLVDNGDGTYSLSTSGSGGGGTSDASAAKQDAQTALLTTITGQLPTTLGQKTKANSISITPASDYQSISTGDVASGSADSGNPVKTGAKYNATLPTFTNGNRADSQADINGFTRVATAQVVTPIATPTVSTSPAYTSGDSVGGKLSLANAARFSGGSGQIVSVTITDKAKQSAPIDILFFTADPTNTTFTDNGALTVNATDLLTLIGKVSVSDYAAFATNSVGIATGFSIPFKLATGTTLYAALVVRGTPTFTSTSDIQVAVGIIPD